MQFDINWTTVIASAVSSAIIGIIAGGAQFVSNRYLARMLDRIEKRLGVGGGGSKKNGGNGEEDDLGAAP